MTQNTASANSQNDPIYYLDPTYPGTVFVDGPLTDNSHIHPKEVFLYESGVTDSSGTAYWTVHDWDEHENMSLDRGDIQLSNQYIENLWFDAVWVDLNPNAQSYRVYGLRVDSTNGVDIWKYANNQLTYIDYARSSWIVGKRAWENVDQTVPATAVSNFMSGADNHDWTGITNWYDPNSVTLYGDGSASYWADTGWDQGCLACDGSSTVYPVEGNAYVD